MELYITELSKYVITMLMALYAYESFAVFRYREEDRRSGIYTRQNFLMLLLHFSCFMVICFETGDMSYLFFYAFQQAVLFATAVLFHMVYPGANRLIVNNMCLLLSVGFVMLTRLSYERAVRQFVIAAVSIAAVMVIPLFVHKIKFLKSLTWVYAFLGIAALTVVLVLGSYTYGSKISYTIAGVTVQPSEFVKILFVFFLASALCGSASFLQVCLTAAVAGIHVVILVFSKDLGSALIFFVVYVLMVFVATGKPLYLLAGAGGGGGAVERYRYGRLPNHPVIVCHQQRRLVRAWAVWGDAPVHPFCGGGFHFFCRGGGAWHIVCHVPDFGVRQLFPDVHGYFHETERPFLPVDCLRTRHYLYFPGFSYHWGRQQIHSADRRDPAPDQLRWKFRTDDAGDVCHCGGALHGKKR